MIARQRGNASFIETSILWMLFAMEIYGGFAQTGQLNVDGKTFSTFSNVTGNFIMTLDSGLLYRLAWRFNESDICTVAVNTGLVLVATSIKCDPASHTSGSDEWYYATNSEIRASWANLSSGVINIDLIYSMAKSEEYPLRMNVYNNGASEPVSNVVDITVQNCKSTSGGLVDTTVSGSCEFDCTTKANCKPGFHSKAINVTCQANGTWYQPDGCTAITCLVETCDDCCYINGSILPPTVVLGYNEALESMCCEGFRPPDHNSFTCTEGGSHPLVLNCDPVTCDVKTCVDCCYINGSKLPPAVVSGYNETLGFKCCAGFNPANPNSFLCTEEENNELELTCRKPETTQPTTISDAYVTSDSITGGNSTKTGMVTGEVSAVSGTGAINKNSGSMSPGDVAGIVFVCIVVTVAVIVVVITLKLLYPMTLALIITYAVAFTLCFAGILMCFLGSDGGSELNGVEIAGIVLASVGTVAAVGALVFQIVQGPNGKS